MSSLYKTLLESLLDFRINEDEKDGKTLSTARVQSFPVKDIFGGGVITHKMTVDSANTLVAYSDEFLSKDNKVLIKHEFKNKQHAWYDTENPNGQLFHQGTTMKEMDDQFSISAAKIMADVYENKLLHTDSDGDRTLSIIKQIGGNMKESKHADSTTQSLIYDELKDFIALSKWTRENMGKRITQWPPGVVLQEDEKDGKPKSKPTKTAEKPGSKPDDIFKQNPDQPIVPGGKKDDDKKDGDKGEAPSFKRSSQSDTLRRASGVTPTDQMRDMLSRMRDVEADPDDPGYPQPTRDVVQRVTPQNLPAVVNDALTQSGVLNPDWHVVANLPGNMAQAIRTVGRRLFKAFTRTPTDDIVMLGNVMGMGPNDAREINAVASWLRNSGQEVSTGDIDFADFIPGYRADIKLYDAAGARFMLVRDFAGQYIYTWPKSDSIEMNNAPRLGR